MMRTQDLCIHTLEETVTRLIVLGDITDAETIIKMRDNFHHDYDGAVNAALIAVFTAVADAIRAEHQKHEEWLSRGRGAARDASNLE